MPISTLTAEKVAKLMQEQEKKVGQNEHVVFDDSLMNSHSAQYIHDMIVASYLDRMMLVFFVVFTWCGIGRLSHSGEQMMRSEDVWQPALLPGTRIAGFETKETFGPVVGGPSFLHGQTQEVAPINEHQRNVETDCLGVSSLATDVFDEVLATVNV